MSAPELEIARELEPAQLRRGLLSTMRSLLVLAQLMTESTGERQILDLAVTAVPSLARCRAVGIERNARHGGDRLAGGLRVYREGLVRHAPGKARRRLWKP